MPFRVAHWNDFLAKLSPKSQRTLILTIPFVSLILIVGGWLWSRQAEAQWWVSHTEELMRESSNLQIELLDAETGIRGYGITENREFLKPYEQAIIEIPNYLNRLKKLTQDNPERQEQLQQLERQIQDRLKLFVKVLQVIEENKKTPQLGPRLDAVLAESKLKMDAIRTSLDEFNEREWQLLSWRRDRLQQIRTGNSILLIIIVITSLLAYWIATRLYYYSQNQLEQRAKELGDLNRALATTNLLLKDRNQELDRFTYIVSHDLKAPLRAIASLSEWLEEDLEGKLDEDTSNQLSLLRSRVYRMDAFIDGLLQYSRAGRMQVEKTLVDVNQLLAEIVDSLNPPENFQIEIVGKMPVLMTESLLLQQVFSNLISNAIKHHPRPDGKVIISVDDRGNDYQFAVADNGAGIDPEYHQKVFEIFQVLTARDRKESTGIGLSIVKKIVETKGGKIWLESEIGKGTTFYFTWFK